MTQRLPFTYADNYTVSRPFTYNGKKYAYGDNFNVEKAECDNRKLRQLYDARYINVKAKKKEKAKSGA